MRNKTLSAIWVFYFFLNAIYLNAQISPRDSAQVKFYLQKVFYYTDVDFDSAVIYSDSLINYAKSIDWYNKEIEGILLKIDLALYRNKSEMAKANLKLAEEFIIAHKEELGSQSRYFEHKRKIGLSLYYHSLGQNDKMESIYNELIFELERNPKSNPNLEEIKLLVNCYINIGGIFKDKGSYTTALDYYHKALSLQNPHDRTRNYIYIANIYLTLGQTNKTIEFAEKALANSKAKFKKSKPKKRDPILINAYYSLVEAYLIDENYELALTKLEESLDYHISNDPLQSTTYEYFGRVHTHLKNYKKAVSFFRKSRILKKEIQKIESHFHYAKPNKYIGDVYLEQGSFIQSLNYYQLAICNLEKEFKDKDYHQNPNLSQVDFKKDLLELLRKKTSTLYQLKLQNSEESNFSQLTQSTSELAMALIDTIRLDYLEDADKQFLLSQSYAIYEVGIDLAFQQENIERAFMLSEKSRAMVLSEGIQRKKARMMADIGEEERARIQKIEKAISDCNIKMQQLNDEEKLANLRNEKFRLKRQHESIMEKINASPKFKQVIKEDHHFNLAAIKEKLKNSGLAMLEFFEGENSIFAFYFDEQQVLKKGKFPKTKALKDALNNIKKNLFEQNNELYVQQAFLIYQKLLAPLFETQIPKRLVIIPDGVLGNIPYDALLTASTDINQIKDFGAFPYLFNQTSLSIAFSAATLLNDDLRLDENHTKQSSLIAYAPSFRGNANKNSQRLIASADRSILEDLVFNKEEVNSIEANYACQKVMNEQASKTHFLKHAANYRNAHIAAHAQVDQSNSDMSYIAFSNVVDTADYDYKLTVDELYSLNLPMDMVVLSACETGVGKVVKGEGIISIARGFAYAGVRSIITTLWNVNDLSTSQLVGHFYQRLDQQEPKDIALQNAMKDYLQSQEVDLLHKHPKYWAAFTVIGNTETIDLGSASSSIWYWAIGGGLLFLLLLFWNRKKI